MIEMHLQISVPLVLQVSIGGRDRLTSGDTPACIVVIKNVRLENTMFFKTLCFLTTENKNCESETYNCISVNMQLKIHACFSQSTYHKKLPLPILP